LAEKLSINQTVTSIIFDNDLVTGASLKIEIK